jgi:hypothetical protein
MKKLCLLLVLAASAILLPAQYLPLVLTAPNGGELWETGSTHAITWTQQNLAGNVMLHLMGADPAGTTTQIAAGIPVGSGTYDWTIPNSIPAGDNYTVRITLAANSGTMIYDVSDGPFSITGGNNPPQPFITVTSPNGGETWVAGTAHPVTWQYASLAGHVRVSLVTNNAGDEIVIAPQVPIAAGNFLWNIPANFQTGSYLVHVVWITDLTVYFGDVSDGAFSIVAGNPPPPQPLVLTSPNGGEIWSIGQTYPITWTWQNLDCPVTLHLTGTNSATPTTLIAAGIPVTEGVFQWTIPNGVVPGIHYRVRISYIDDAGVTIADFSDGPFTIETGTNPPPQGITVIAPNGGETWVAGTAHPILWSFSGLEGMVRISLIQANGTQDLVIAPEVPIAAGSFMWQIPSTFPAGMYRAHIVWTTDLAVYIADMSDGFFSIVPYNPPPPQALTLTSPNGGEVWNCGQTHPITWIHQNLNGPIDLHLIGQNTYNPLIPIASGVPVTDGMFNWTIPAGITPGYGYLVRISWLDAAGIMIFDLSDAPFTIGNGTPPPQTYFTVVSPNGGEVWQTGTPHPIEWAYANLEGQVRILLAEGPNSQEIVIAPQVPIGACQFVWNIPDDFPTGMYMAHIVWISVTGVYFGDLSDGFFTIEPGNPPPPPQPITVISPNGGEVWEAGSTHPITWATASMAGTVMIHLLGGPYMTPVFMIANGIPASDGSYEWAIPATLVPGDAYQIQINLTDSNGMLNFDASDGTFTITSGNTPPPPALAVVTPNGGEVWYKGSQNTITWTDSEYNGSVQIFLLRRQGQNTRRLLIARNAPNTGSFGWQIPYRLPPGNQYLILIRRPGGGMDISDGQFSILNPLVNVRTSPNPTQGETTVSFELKSPLSCSLRIYNLKGQLVRSLAEERMLSGSQDLVWDGRDFSGRAVSAGIYLARISSPELTMTRKIMVVK